MLDQKTVDKILERLEKLKTPGEFNQLNVIDKSRNITIQLAMVEIEMLVEEEKGVHDS